MVTVQNIALENRNGQVWPISPVVPAELEQRSSERRGGPTLSIQADAIPDDLRADAVVAASADHSALQPACAVDSIELRTRPGDRGEQWVLHLDEPPAGDSP